MRPTLIALALLLSPLAEAITPEGAVHQGIEPQRVFHDNPSVQARLAQRPEFQALLEDAPGWRARFDEVTGAPWRLWGSPIPMPTDSAAELSTALSGFLDEHATLLNYEAGTLELRGARYSARLDTWYVDFHAPIAGVPVWRGGLTARVKHGNLVLIGALAYGDRATVGGWDLPADRAIDRAIALGPEPAATHLEPTAERIWLPVHDREGLRLVATWLVRTRTHEVPGKWVSFVDGRTGELLSVHNEVRFAEGTVSGWHAQRTVDGSPLVQSLLPEAVVSDGVDVAVTGVDGAFSLAGPDFTTTLDGAYVTVANTNGEDGLLLSANPDLDWTTADATQAEISSYVYLHHVRDWGNAVAPEVPMVQGPIRSNVNITDQSCNAYFDGEVNFYAAADGCANTGEIADVNYHEWGHGFHMYSLESQWTGFDGSLSEGAADTVSFLLTGDSRIAPHFFNGGGAIRDVSPNRVYPADYQASQEAVHSNGLIFGGAMWDLWGALVDLEGLDQGTRSTEQIFAGLLKGGPGVADAYEEALLADDDDGNLANGTPHECELIEAFGAHGLGPLGSGGGIFQAAHTPRSVHPELGEPYEVRIELQSAAPGCYDIDPTGGQVHYRVNGKGGWQSAALSVVPGAVVGAIPVLEPGSFVEYWTAVEDASGADFSLPAGGEINPFSFYVGPVLEVYCNDFENGRGKFTHELVSGEPGDGADDWQWGSPAGNGGDPAAAFSGEKVWGNDLGWDEFNGEYQSGKKNRLTSPALSTAHYLDSFLSFQRWLTIEDAVWDQGRISADDTVVWGNARGVDEVGGRDHLDRDWAPQAIPLDGAGDDGSVVLDWTLTSDGGLTFGGWNLDDVCLFAPDTPDNRLGISGITAERTDEGVRLSWTQPLHQPAETVFVVRADGALPTSPNDGVLIWSTRDFELGGTGTLLDPDPPRWDTAYAIYAAGDDQVLSWTREGFNAVMVAGDGPAPKRSGGEGLGCGCATGGPAAPSLAVLALLGLALRRRR